MTGWAARAISALRALRRCCFLSSLKAFNFFFLNPPSRSLGDAVNVDIYVALCHYSQLWNCFVLSPSPSSFSLSSGLSLNIARLRCRERSLHFKSLTLRVLLSHLCLLPRSNAVNRPNTSREIYTGNGCLSSLARQEKASTNLRLWNSTRSLAERVKQY